MATITKTPSATWKAIIRKSGWPTTIKTFRTKRDAQDWSRGLEDEIVRGVHVNRSSAEKFLITDALDRYQNEITPQKKSTTQRAEKKSYCFLTHRLRPLFINSDY